MTDQLDLLAAALADTQLATWLRFSRWGYAAVNAAHILGIALLVGSVLPLDLKFLGFWRTIPRSTLARVLVPTAAFGLLLAVSTGTLLYSVRATEYVRLDIFVLKIGLIALGAASAILIHLIHGLWLESVPKRWLTVAGLVSMTCWLGALACGRSIAFVMG